MSLEIPNLDDKTFEELFQEARALIPRYAPQWTDHNFSDPGITFIDLFAWLAEMQIYSANRITSRHKLKFLKYLGMSQRPACSSTASVKFTLRNVIQPVFIPNGTLLFAADRLTGLFEPFETAQDVNVTAATLARTLYIRGNAWIDVSESISSVNGYFEPFTSSQTTEGRLILGLDNSASGNSLRMLFNLVESDLPVCSQATAQCDALPSVRLHWQIWNGSSWQALTVIDETCGLNHTGYVNLSGLENGMASQLRDIKGFDNAPASNLYTWISITPSGNAGETYEISPRIHSIQLHAVPVTHGRTWNDECYSGTGLPLQVVFLKNTPVLAGTINLHIDGREWCEVTDFDASGPMDLHFIIDCGKGVLQFGDGEKGMIPAPGINNIVIRTYRSGGGVKGNIGKDTIVRIDAPEYGNVVISGSSEAIGGCEEENLSSAIDRARRERKYPTRLITENDIEEIVKRTPGTRLFSVTSLFGYHPLFQAISMPGTITLVVVPFTRYTHISPPAPPGDGFLSRIKQFINNMRLITTDLHVIGPKYVPVAVDAQVHINPKVNRETLYTFIETAIINFLNPFIGGAAKKGWELGKPVVASDLVALLQEIEGVVCVKKLHLSGDGCTETGDKILLPKTGLACSAVHTITVVLD